ncbi:MAG: prolyl-tRNA synthetase associated domain-containing protein [Gemmatimonadaceae bacterium]
MPARIDPLLHRYRRFDHPPVYTCEEADRFVPAEARGIQTKNLFLRDKRGRRHWLVVTNCEKSVDIRALGAALGAGRLSFGSPERLMRYLGVTPGSVTLLALVRDEACDVELVIDADVWTGEALRCHPLTNAATLVLSKSAVEQFLALGGHDPVVLSLAEI